MIRLIIGDDHTFIREGLKRIVNMDPNLKLVGEAANSIEILNAVANKECDILILDINLPDRNGLELMKDLLKLNPELKVIIFSMHPENIYAVRAIKAGAFGYLSKESPIEEFSRAIMKVSAGHKYLSENATDMLTLNISRSEDVEIHKLLTDREFEVFYNLALGKTLRETGEVLKLSISTVNTYKKRILSKMKFSSNFEIVQYAISNKIISV